MTPEQEVILHLENLLHDFKEGKILPIDFNKENVVERVTTEDGFIPYIKENVTTLRWRYKKNMFENFFDKRGREWEWFIDMGYWDMIAVRPVGDKKFNSPLLFHFATSKKAQEFVELLKEAT